MLNPKTSVLREEPESRRSREDRERTLEGHGHKLRDSGAPGGWERQGRVLCRQHGPAASVRLPGSGTVRDKHDIQRHF